MRPEKRRTRRVQMEHTPTAKLMAIDGTWQRACSLLDVSASGAKLCVDGSVDVLNAREFFLLLSSTGLAYRRCELVRIDGEQVGVRFITTAVKKPRLAAMR